MRRRIGYALATILATSLLSSSTALAWFSLEPEAGLLDGFTQYEIFTTDLSGQNLAISRLKFELHSPVIGGKLTGSLPGGLTAYAEGWTKMSSPGTVLEDSDWLPDDGQPGLDIYSESDLDLRQAYVLDGGVEIPLGQDGSWTVAARAGLRHQHFDLSASDAYQIGYGIYGGGDTGFVPGDVLDYSVSYDVPYAGLSVAIPAGEAPLFIDITYSPRVSAHDVDDHLLRGKRSTGDSTGTALAIGLREEYPLNDTVTLTGYVDYTLIRARGTQVQYWYEDEVIDGVMVAPAGTTEYVDQEQTSRQTVIGLTVSAKF